MKNKSNFFNKFVTLLAVFSLSGQSVAFAQAPLQQDKLRIGYNDTTGKVSFIGADPSRPIAIRSAQVQGLTADSSAKAMIAPYAADFGLKNPASELELISADQVEGRKVTRYQQVYKDIPIMGGEMIVNATDQAELLSLSAEISPDLMLDINPSISPRQAQTAALESMAKSHQVSKDVLETTEPELWIYDSRLLEPDGTQVTLVWRMEVKSKDSSLPVNELVLVDAKRGAIVLNFNQIDMAWATGTVRAGLNPTTLKQDDPPSELPTVTPTPIVTETPAPDVTETPVTENTDILTLTPESQKLIEPRTAGAATTYYVNIATGNDGNSCTSVAAPCKHIQETINKASGGDTIKVVTGTYTGTGTEVVLINKSITLSGGWNASFISQSGTTTIDGQSLRRGVNIPYQYPDLIITTTMERFTVQNGFTSSIGGGGIYNSYGSLTLNDSVVSGNISQGSGGGIFNFGTLIISNSTISGNSTNGSSTGGDGGGIKNYGGSITVNNSLIFGNFIRGSSSGSGIDNGGTLILNNSTVSENTGGDGAGISAGSGATVLNNSTISNNRSYGINNKIGNVTLRNTIIARNEKDCFNDNAYNGTIISQGYNLIGNSTFCTFTSAAGDIKGTTANPIKPLLTQLQDNGGPTLTNALMVGSPAIDAGNPALPGSGGNACLATDQRGTSRPVNMKCDIGAYEGSVPRVPVPSISTYWFWGIDNMPGGILCNQSQPICTNDGNRNTDADAAHRYAIGTYNFYISHHNRDSIDNDGMTIISTVGYCENSICPYDNAFWSGTQMVYGQWYPAADDVVAHELTHGVTQYESNLFYYYQSGAINESFSDVWGELYDQQNGLGNDAANVKWLFGEDLPGGAIRSMSNPPASPYNDPDKMTSSLYIKDTSDSGGVHTNSGINNKAAYLMVDGGSFNGKTVTAIGVDKTLAIYYEVQTNLLTSGADYADLYNALYQGCLNLVGGAAGIVSGNCQQVRNATDAVEMSLQPVANFNTDATMCSAGLIPNDTLYDNLESGISNWTMVNGGTTRWQYDSPYGTYAHSGTHFLYADDFPATVTDAYVALKPITIPANGYLHFAQAYDFEKYSNDPNYYDGGVLEYSINGGANWVDAGSLIQANGYSGTITTSYNNPLKGRSAFVGTSHGYISTRLNLSSLAGKSVIFRWRMGLDDGGFRDPGGWWLDDVQIYKCISDNPYVVSSLRASSNPTAASSVNFTVTFSEAVTGVDMTGPAFDDFTLTTSSGITGASITGVSGSGATYTVTVNTGSGSGTIRLDVPSTATINDLTGNPLSGLPFITGESYAVRTVNVYIGGILKGSYPLASGEEKREYYPVSGGPVKVEKLGGTKIIAAIRLQSMTPAGTLYSFVETMGMPKELVSYKYYFPTYNNTWAPLNSQIRFANLGTAPTDVTVTIGGNVVKTYYNVPAQGEIRDYYNVSGGPVIVEGKYTTDKIIAAIRLQSMDASGNLYSFAETMGVPEQLLSDTYYFPTYNNTWVPLNSQIRFANLGTAPTDVTVTIGGNVVKTYYNVPAQGEIRDYYNISGGPVIVESSGGTKIIAAIRLQSMSASGTLYSFVETMGVPKELVTDKYYFPTYNNTWAPLNSQVRFANLGTAPTDIRVTIGGNVVKTYYNVPAQGEIRDYYNISGGPVIVESVDGTTKIIAAIRLQSLSAAGILYSFAETMGVPKQLLSDTYYLPTYNNTWAPLNSQLRFGVP